MDYIYWLLDYIKQGGGEKGDENIPPIHKQSMKLNPLSEFSVQFISIAEWEKAPEINKQLKKNMWYLNKALQTNKQNLDSHLKYPPKLNPLLKTENIQTEDQRQYQILLTLSNEYYNEIFEEQKNLYEKAIDLIQEMINFCDNIIANSYPVSVDTTKFLDAIQRKTNDQDKIKLQNKRKNAFQQLIKINSSKQQAPPPITSKQLIQAIDKAMEKFDIDAKFMSESEFDDVYEDFANVELKEEFDDLLSLISNFEYARALSNLAKNVEKLLESFKINIETESDKYYIVYYSAVRYLFSRVTIELPYILTNDLLTKSFLSNSEYIQQQTPNHLNALSYLFLPSQYNKTLNEIFHGDKYLSEAIDWLSLLQFHSSPIDIARLAANAINVLNTFIGRSIYINKTMHGDENAQVPDNAISESLCFDDIFTLFYMAFAVNPPANSIAISEFLHAFGKFHQSGTLDYASTTIQAAIEFIKDYQSNPLAVKQ